jgi:hypothetical protein
VNDKSILYNNDLIILKTDNLLIEAKIINDNVILNALNDFSQTFNPTEISRPEDTDDLIPVNDTTKQFIFRLLKIFIENFFLKIKNRQNIMLKEQDQVDQINECENEIRILKDWNSFILINMNKVNIMNEYENAVFAVEKYLICELAKYSQVDDLNVYYTYD